MRVLEIGSPNIGENSQLIGSSFREIGLMRMYFFNKPPEIRLSCKLARLLQYLVHRRNGPPD